MNLAGEGIDAVLAAVGAEGRTTLYEHEGYAIIQALGIADVPRHVFMRHGEEITAAQLAALPGERVVLKIVSPDIAHKTEAGGVSFLPRDLAAVHAGTHEMLERAGRQSSRVAGTLICECIQRDTDALGSELFVGLRRSREFGPVVTAGLGGTETELLCEALAPWAGQSLDSVLLSSPEAFLDAFRQTLGYKLISGEARGRIRSVSDHALLRCFAGFFGLGRQYGWLAGQGAVHVEEFEINPLLVAQRRLVALDAVCRLGHPPAVRSPRPIRKVAHLLRPRSIALAGVSSKSMNLGRIILRNIRDGGFGADRLWVVKPDEAQIDGVPCAGSFKELPGKVDLAVIAIGADHAPQVVREIVDADAAESAIIIPGGMGETAAGAGIEHEIQAVIAEGHHRPSGGPVFLGGNCMGMQSRPGKYDTFFIPKDKWDPRLDIPPRRLAFVSQSGAFLITRLSNVGCLDPAYAVSVGNQIDLTAADVLEHLADDDTLDTYAVYIEGLIDGDGLHLARVVKRINERGKTVIVYRAGRTEAGRSATAGHTSVLAGDYAVCAAVLTRAGAIVADDFREFERLVELSTTLHAKRVTGLRLGLITNAGFEAVGMADALGGRDHRLALGRLGAATSGALRRILAECRLDAIVNAGNPLDLTPMADEEAYDRCARLMLDEADIDVVIVSVVPMTPRLKTTHDELLQPTSLVNRLAAASETSSKPLVTVVDSGVLYDPLVAELRRRRIAVFRSADEAVRALGRYLRHRVSARAIV